MSNPETINEAGVMEDLRLAEEYFDNRTKRGSPPIEDYEEAIGRAIYGAIKLLKESGPRLMTPLEVFGVDSDGLVYVEFMDTITPALITEKTIKEDGHTKRWVATQQLSGAWLIEEFYGINWRCWTKRPTDEQRHAVEWDPEPA